MRSLLVFLAAFALSTAALAQDETQQSSSPRANSVLGRGQQAFGKKVDSLKEKGVRKGVDLKGSVAQGKIGTQTGEGNAKRGCTAEGKVLSGSIEANAGVNKDTFAKGPKTTKTGGKCGKAGQVIGAGVEGSLVSASGECATAVGTIGASGRGVGASAGISACEIEAKADLIYGEVSYETPSVTVCGVTASGTVTAGAGIGLGAGVGRQGTVGAKGRLGPVKVGVGANVGVDAAGAKECGKKIVGWFKGLFQGTVKVLAKVGEAQAAQGQFFLP